MVKQNYFELFGLKAVFSQNDFLLSKLLNLVTAINRGVSPFPAATG